ncbi:MAG: hypothetical protein HY000_14805 [Planctomycetes bacterium]|nr:hypothetical protein [Planctomycetota bacterium]
MLPKDVDIFCQVAKQLNCYILLREPNPLSARHFGKPDCVAKGLDCKAKTANDPIFKFGGLVTDPSRKGAFTQESLEGAKATWKDFALPPGWTCVAHGEEEGLVKNWEGKYLYADYDLMHVQRAGDDEVKLKGGVRNGVRNRFRTDASIGS